MSSGLDGTLTAKENAFRRTLWTREEVLGLLLLQRRDDAAAIRANPFPQVDYGLYELGVKDSADLIDPEVRR